MRWGIKARLFFSMLVLGILPLVLSGMFSYSITRQASLAEAQDKLKGMPGPAGRRLEEMFYFRWNDTLLLSRSPLFTEGSDSEQQSAYLREILRLYAPYAWLGVADAAGRLIAATEEQSPGREVGGETWFQGAKAIAPDQPAEAAVHLQDVHRSELSGGQPVIGFSAPLYDRSGRFRGVVHTEVRLSFAAENVRNLRAGHRGAALLLDRDGRVLAGRDGVAFESDLSFSGRPSFRLARSGRSGISLEPNEKGEEVWVGYAPLQGFSHYPGLGWSLLVFQPAREISAAAGEQARFFAAATLVGIAAILLGGYFLLERWISRPIATLCAGAERIGAGQWDRRIEVGQGGEIGRLAASLDRMAEDLQSLQERLVQASLREFCFEIVHELGNPLAALCLATQVLQEQTGRGSRHGEIVAPLAREAARIDKLLQIFLSFAHPQMPNPTPGDLRGIVEVALTLLQELLQRDIAIRREYTTSLPRVNVDHSLMHQALFGLLWRMAKEIQAGEQLRVGLAAGHEPISPAEKGVRREVPSVTLSISCAGQIIAPEQLRRIFSPLYDVRSQGSGLSLAFARQIIQLHGGRLTVESQGDKGTTITVYLPGAPGGQG